MSGFEPILVTRRSDHLGPGVIGRFSVPDIDAPDAVPELLPDPAVLAEAVLQARLADAREAGFAEGEASAREAAAASHAARETAALEGILAALREGREAAGEAAHEAAAGLAGLLITAISAGLPAAAARLAPETAVQLAADLRPLLEDGIAVTLRVAPGVAAAAAARINEPSLTIIEDASLPAGDATATWRGGGAIVSLADRQKAIDSVLTVFDLKES
jgi:hypothetical protein